MKKFLFLFCALMLSAVGMKAQDDLQGAYEAAMAAIEEGKTYHVFTEWNGQKFYLTKGGTLVSEGAGEPDFFKFTKVAGEEYPFGFKLADAYFTNPGLNGSDAVLNSGKINTNTSARDTWEAQVFFLKDGKYAVRATNALGGESSWALTAKAFWTVNEGAEGPVAQYSFDPDFAWQLEIYTDVKFEKFDEIQGLANKLQTLEGLVSDAAKFSSNAKESSEGSYEALLDGDYNSFFHSQWSGTGPDEDHYLQAELTKPTDKFIIYFYKRGGSNCNNRPTQIDIEGSNDGLTFAPITSITEGLPTAADNTVPSYTSEPIAAPESYKYLRFTVPSTNNGAMNNGHVFFTFSEFYILPADELVTTAAPLLGIYSYTELTDADIETIGKVEKLMEAAEQEKAYDDALAAIESGKTYRVFTEKGGQKFYLDAGGYLIDNVKKAPSFTFTAVTASGTLYETGWNLGCKFTNPETYGQTTFENDGHIHVGGNDRNDWERQVFFLNNEGKYAVRATNADNPAWGSNTYWDVFDSAELPEAGYSLDPAYVWQIEEFVDNRPEIFASLEMDKVQAWAGKLQSIEGLVTDGSQWISNAKDPVEGSYEALLDGDYTTFFHSTWHGGEYDPQADHFLQAELPEATKEFYIYFKKRSQNNNNRPTQIDITASNDGENFTTEPISITEGLPTGATPIDYMSAKITLEEPSKFIRFTVPSTNNMAKTGDHVFFTFSEFYILPANELTAAAVPYMKIGDYTDLDFDTDAAAINAAIDNVDKQIEEAIAAAEKEKAYNNALAAIEDGKFYRIFTEVDGQKYYVTEDGKLANVTDDGGIFSFTKVTGGAYMEYGFKIDGGSKRFTNPPLANNVADMTKGVFATTTTDRNDWEAQVLFLSDGKYAIRSCNVADGTSSWNDAGRTYWTTWTVEDAVVPRYTYDLTYEWQLEGPLTPIQVTYALYEADGTEPISTVAKRQDANSEIKVPADMTSHFAYDYTTEGTIGEEDCTIKVIRTFKEGVVHSFDDLSNAKAYTIRCDRGALLTKDGYLASTAHSTLTDAEPAEFAIINNDGNYYLYSVADKKFVLNNGALAEAPSHGVEDAIKMVAKTDPYFFWYFTINGTNNGLNTNGANPYGYVINTWMTEDEGNLYYMIESSDFDATEALAYFPATYTVSEAHDYGHWYRADVEGDSIAYSFAFNNSYKSADEILQVQVADAESDSLINHVNKGVFVLNEGFRINTGGDRYVQKFTLTVPRDYEIIDYTIDNSIPGAARGLYKYSLNEDMSNAVLIGADLYNLYEGNEETKDIISEEVGGTRQFNFYLEPVITDEGGSIIDVVLKVNVRRIQHVEVASTEFNSIKVNGSDVTFVEGKASLSDSYKNYNIELKDEAATYEVKENLVTVIGEDGKAVMENDKEKTVMKSIDIIVWEKYDPLNKSVYTVEFHPSTELTAKFNDAEVAFTDKKAVVNDSYKPEYLDITLNDITATYVIKENKAIVTDENGKAVQAGFLKDKTIVKSIDIIVWWDKFDSETNTVYTIEFHPSTELAAKYNGAEVEFDEEKKAVVEESYKPESLDITLNDATATYVIKENKAIVTDENGDAVKSKGGKDKSIVKSIDIIVWWDKFDPETNTVYTIEFQPSTEITAKYDGMDVAFDEEGKATIEDSYKPEVLEITPADATTTYVIKENRVAVTDEDGEAMKDKDGNEVTVVKSVDIIVWWDKFDAESKKVYTLEFDADTEIKIENSSDSTTGIEGIAGNSTEPIFNLAGRRVAKAQKGVYIINGKKVMVK